jgi:hypothetical protein
VPVIYIQCHCAKWQVVLSAAPDSGSKYIVAASSNHRCLSELFLWQPGMISWHVCFGVHIDGPKDIAFYQGKLYVLLRHSRTGHTSLLLSLRRMIVESWSLVSPFV